MICMQQKAHILIVQFDEYANCMCSRSHHHNQDAEPAITPKGPLVPFLSQPPHSLFQVDLVEHYIKKFLQWKY